MRLNCFFFRSSFDVLQFSQWWIVNILNVVVFFLYFHLLCPQCFSFVAYHLYFNFNLYSFEYLLGGGLAFFAYIFGHFIGKSS